ncbi:GH92 family glycosyl hydrolase [Mucilaginibacter roseus]|uniref:GH92 family glycosyl hydrolase n=1 Tax=Mucilaginibacter roseus TaxID=1528868 RepID=A0ABS8U7L2_9SPHI|nr:GH92 family glycosyl hydrolase [Mucilaginibacter roseus]MCD8742205.1 GH92 family glycosyl hydrolase [Mucilaginibacter roseus]
MKKSIFSLLALAALCGGAFGQGKPTGLSKYVDPYIGTGFHGHVFMGANVPFGAVQLGPVNVSEGWDWCSGYHISDTTIVGFSHTRLSGTGIGDLGDIALMPTTGPIKVAKGSIKDQESGFISTFNRSSETANAGFYAVKLNRYNIGVKLTTTPRVGFHEYTFPKNDQSHIVIDLQQGIGWDRPMKTSLTLVNDTTITGYRYSEGWAVDQRIYFTMILSKPVKTLTVYDSTTVKTGTSIEAVKAKGVVTFATKDGEKVYVKVGISPVSVENAALNMKTELPGWDFAGTVTKAQAAWDKALNKVAITTPDEDKKKVFYTAMYHTMIAPSTFNDVNGDYWGTDKKVHKNEGFNNLTTFSLWDTYRAADPMYTLLHPERVSDMINTMLAIYKQQGKLPVWHLMANETNCMVGYSAIPVVVDAYLKGYKGFDEKLAWEAVKATAMGDERGIKFVKSLGYVPADSTAESVSMGLEYALADWSAAQMAKKMGNTADYEYFTKRGNYYKNYFDSKTGFFRAKLADGKFKEPFDPFRSIHERGDYTEGNAWQYQWLVPQDVEGLIKLLGGDKKFAAKLDTFFVAEGDMGDKASDDISGLIGQYAHGNEPSHHITYLYAYAGKPWKTAEKVRYIMKEFYTTKPDGIIGNEDVGQMSAWYVLSSLGFYPVNPANGNYVFGSPLFNEAVINLPEGKKFKLTARNNSDENKYIQSVTLNGKPYTKAYISHTELMKGGELVFVMGNKPNLKWGTKAADRPYSMK